MAWIESHQELRDHPKTKRFARRLGVSVPTAIGHLHCLWWWALDYAPDGDISDYDAEDIADAAMWDGDPQEFLTALIECGPGGGPGFVERDEHGMRLHDWDEYGNEYKVRSRAAERKRRSRERSRQNNQASRDGNNLVTGQSRDSHVTVTGQSQDSHTDVTLDKTRQDRTGQDKTGQPPPNPPVVGVEPSVGPSSESVEPAADLAAVARHYGERIGIISPGLFHELGEWQGRGMEAAVLVAAIDRTADARAEGRIRGSPDSYLRGVIRQMYNDGIRTVDDLRSRGRADPRSPDYDPVSVILERAAEWDKQYQGGVGGDS